MLFTTLTILMIGWAQALPATDGIEASKSATNEVPDITQNDDLKTAASSYYVDRYSNYGVRDYPSSYSGAGVTGYGTLDDKYNYNSFGGPGGYNYGYNGYDRGSGYNNYAGNPGYDGYRGGYGSEYAGGYGGGAGYNGYAGNGGYGGYAGSGGLTSYYGYNNPNYQAANHLGYGYYNKRPGYGNIYNSGITPSLVTGYRGYSRK